jgi:hypothetical protein
VWIGRKFERKREHEKIYRPSAKWQLFCQALDLATTCFIVKWVLRGQAETGMLRVLQKAVPAGSNLKSRPIITGRNQL